MATHSVIRRLISILAASVLITSPVFSAPGVIAHSPGLHASDQASAAIGMGFTYQGQLSTVFPARTSTQTDILGPVGSGEFGSVTVLPNGNIVVVDTGYDAPGPIIDVGAVYLYNGATGALISTLTGSSANDWVGAGGVMVTPQRQLRGE